MLPLDLSQETKEVTGGTNKGLVWQGRQGPLRRAHGVYLLLLFNFLAMKVSTGKACCHSWDPLSLLHACATRTHICFQLSAYRDQRGRARACAWLQPLPPRSSGAHSPSGKGDDATGGNDVSLRQRRALCQVPVK